MILRTVGKARSRANLAGVTGLQLWISKFRTLTNNERPPDSEGSLSRKPVKVPTLEL
jgi:hypothetical protein